MEYVKVDIHLHGSHLNAYKIKAITGFTKTTFILYQQYCSQEIILLKWSCYVSFWVCLLFKSTFHSYQCNYICSDINKYYTTEQVYKDGSSAYIDITYSLFCQNKVLSQCKSKLVLAGDGHCDSPGSSAKYVLYLLLC